MFHALSQTNTQVLKEKCDVWLCMTALALVLIAVAGGKGMA